MWRRWGGSPPTEEVSGDAARAYRLIDGVLTRCRREGLSEDAILCAVMIAAVPRMLNAYGARPLAASLAALAQEVLRSAPVEPPLQ
jgi:hypothetical protein